MMIVLAYNPCIAVKYNSYYFTDNIRQVRRICAQAVIRYYPYAVRKIIGTGFLGAYYSRNKPGITPARP